MLINHLGRMKVIDELPFIEFVVTPETKGRMSSTELSWTGTEELEVSPGISEWYNETKILGRQANNVGLLQVLESLEYSEKTFYTPLKAMTKTL